MFQKYYTNNTLIGNDIMILSLYGKGIYILPRQEICSEYFIPFNSTHALNFFKYYKEYYKMNIDLPAQLTSVIKICGPCGVIARSLQAKFHDMLVSDSNHVIFKEKRFGRITFGNILKEYSLC